MEKVPNILLLDDSKIQLVFIEELIKKSGYNVTGVENSTGFYNQLEINKYDLILLDVILPGTDGYKICKDLKAHPDYQSIPIIFITSLTKEKDVIKGLEAGAEDFITKPFNEQIFILRINSVLSKFSHLKQQKLIAKIAKELISLDEIEGKIDGVIKEIGEYTNVDRVFIFEEDVKGDTISYIYEWCNEGILPQINNFQNYSRNEVPSWGKLIQGKDFFYSNNVNEFPEDVAKVFIDADVKSVYVAPIIVHNKKYGFFGFVHCNEYHKWTKSEIDFFTVLKGVFSSTFERIVIENELKNSEKNYRMLFENINHNFAVHKVIIDSDNKPLTFVPVEVNSLFLKTFGFDKCEVLNKDIRELFVFLDQARIQRYCEVGINGKPIEFIEYNAEKNRYFHVNAYSPKPGYVATNLIDVTEQISIEKALKKSELHYRTLFEKSKDSIMLFQDNYFIDCNIATLESLQLKSKKEFLKLKPWDISPMFQPDGASSKEKAGEMVRLTIEKGFHEFDWVHKNTKEENIWFHKIMLSIKIDDELIIYSLGRDITKKKKDEQVLKVTKDEQVKLNMELRAINKELVKQQKELKLTQEQLVQSEKMASLGVLSAGLAHEINNPLNYISSGVSGLKEHYNKLINYIEHLNLIKSNHNLIALLAYINKNEKSIKQAIEFTNKMLVHITGGIGKTSEIIDSMRVFSARSENSFAQLNINEVIDSVLVMLYNTYKNNISVNKEYNDDVCLRGNTSKLYQVFMNLISNAIHAIDDKGEIWITTKLDANGDHVIITIKDSGKGIPPKLQSKIFDPFFTTKKVGQGIGLGLYIAYSIINQHKGKLELRSSSDKGTEFVVQLPIIKDK